MVDVNFDLKMNDTFSECFDNFNFKLTNSETDQNNNFEDQNNTNVTITSSFDLFVNNETKRIENTVGVKHELNIDNDQNCKHFDHDNKKIDKYSIEETEVLITSSNYKSDIVRLVDLNTEFNISTDVQASSDDFTDSGCFSSTSTIEYDRNVLDNATDISPKEYVNNFNMEQENYTNPINDTSTDVDICGGSEFKNVDSDDSNCSGYHSSDFEFIDENEAKEYLFFNIKEFNGNIVLKAFDVSNKEVYLNSTEDRSKYFGLCQNHFIPEGEDFLVLFQTASNTQNCYNLIPSTSHLRNIALEVQMFNESNKDSEDNEREAKATVKNILSMYRQQNKYYNGIL